MLFSILGRYLRTFGGFSHSNLAINLKSFLKLTLISKRPSYIFRSLFFSPCSSSIYSSFLSFNHFFLLLLLNFSLPYHLSRRNMRCLGDSLSPLPSVCSTASPPPPRPSLVHLASFSSSFSLLITIVFFLLPHFLPFRLSTLSFLFHRHH